jgi:NADH-quinone oxidoreductase subunit F
MGPLILVEPGGWLYTRVRIEDCEEIVEKTIVGKKPVHRLAYQKNGTAYTKRPLIINRGHRGTKP